MFSGNGVGRGTQAGAVPNELPPRHDDRLNDLLAAEPAHAEPNVAWNRGDHDRRPLTLRRLMAPYAGALLGCLLLVIIETVATWIWPLLTQLAIDHGMGLKNVVDDETHGSERYLFGIFIIYLVSITIAILVSRWRTLGTGVLAERLLYTLRVRVFSQLQRLSVDFFARQKKGVLISRMTSDIENTQAMFQEGLVQLLMQGLTLLVLGAQLFLFNAQLAIISLGILFPAIGTLTWWFRRASQRGYLAVRDRLAEVLTHLAETLSGNRVVAANNRQRVNIENHADIVQRYHNANNYTATITAIYGPGSEVIGRLTVIAVLLLGGSMVFNGHMQVGELAGFLLATATFFGPMQQMTQLYNTYQQGQASMTRLRELLLAEPTVAQTSQAYQLKSVEGRVTLDRLNFSYDNDNPVLHDVSLDIPPGETLALVGPTGAGKSTIAKLITRAYDPTAGRVLIDGHDLRDIQIDSLHQHLSVVPQEPFLFSTSMRENIAFARPDATDTEIIRTVQAVGLADFIERAPEGIHTIVGERGASLAAGERQLVALARALLAEPAILVLDEATSGLDLKTEDQVARALDVVLDERTAIIIAHRLSTAVRADRIAVINDGRVAELGTHRELMMHGGLYAAMYATWEEHNEYN